MDQTNPKIDFSDLDDLGATPQPTELERLQAEEAYNAEVAPTDSGTVRMNRLARIEELKLAAAAPRYGVNLAHRPGPHAPTDAPEHEIGFRQSCVKCGGTGSFRGWSGRLVGRCFACEGKGYKLTKTSPAQLAQNRARALDRKFDKLAENGRGFADQFPDVNAYLVARAGRWSFAQEMLVAASKYGHLTEGQMAAVRRAMARDAERAAADAQPKAAVDVNSLQPLITALKHARESGLKWARLTVAGEPPITFSLAKDSSSNAGCIYAKADGQYLGKITPDGQLRLVSEGRAQESAIREACKDPLAKAKLYGLQTGRCGCCGRELTDPESIAAGIGPICAGRFGW